MTLIISFRRLHEEKDITVMVESEQTIAGTIQVLEEAGIIEKGNYHAVRSMRTKARIKTEKRYSEGNIYNGDILLLDS